MFGNKQVKTRTPEKANNFRFPCPVFRNNVRIADCLTVVYHHMRGELIEKRRGCHACIASSRCPAQAMEREEWRVGRELYFSAQEKVGRFSDHVLDATKSVLVLESRLTYYQASEAERRLIRDANANAVPANEYSKRSRATEIDHTEIFDGHERTADADVEAAMQGDMSAAINEAMKSE